MGTITQKAFYKCRIQDQKCRCYNEFTQCNLCIDKAISKQWPIGRLLVSSRGIVLAQAMTTTRGEHRRWERTRVMLPDSRTARDVTALDDNPEPRARIGVVVYAEGSGLPLTARRITARLFGCQNADSQGPWKWRVPVGKQSRKVGPVLPARSNCRSAARSDGRGALPCLLIGPGGRLGSGHPGSLTRPRPSGLLASDNWHGRIDCQQCCASLS